MPMMRGARTLSLLAGVMAAQASFAETVFRGTLAQRTVVEGELPAADGSPVRVGYRFGAAAGSTTLVRAETVAGDDVALSLEIRDAAGALVLEASSDAGAELTLFLDDDPYPVDDARIYMLTLGGPPGSGPTGYRLEFEHRDHGNPAPSPDRSIALAPNVWHMLMPPVETDASFRDLLVTDGGLDADAFVDDVGGGAFAVYAWDPAAVDANGRVTGGYRRPTLDEPIGSEAGFWFMHLGRETVTLEVPDESARLRSRLYGDGGEDGRGPAERSWAESPPCPEDGICVAQPLAPAGGWAMTGVPSLRPATVGEMRFFADVGAACEEGCALDAAAARGLMAGAVYTYDRDTSGGREYTARNPGSRVPPWQAFWTFAADGAGPGAGLSVPMGSSPRTD